MYLGHVLIDNRHGPAVDATLTEANGRAERKAALEMAKLMRLEEPIPVENIEAYRLIAEETSMPICAGKNIYLAYGFRRLLEIGGVDIIMPDLQKTGGLGEGQASPISQICTTFRLRRTWWRRT